MRNLSFLLWPQSGNTFNVDGWGKLRDGWRRPQLVPDLHTMTRAVHTIKEQLSLYFSSD